MGIDIHGLNFLRYALKKSGMFGKTAVIGRQSIAIPRKKDIKKILNLTKEVDYGVFCEEILRINFGAVNVDSYDFSDYEGATHICDMNKPLPPHLINHEHKYDTVIDFGSLEHIFNLPQALKNLSTMCHDGGVILHVLPANNWCGHGFWQFSPELFYSLYSEDNGYAETEVFFADLNDNKHWYKVKKPENGIRRLLENCSQVYVLVRTKKITNFSHDNVQQSDYIHNWKNKNFNDLNTMHSFRKIKKFVKNYHFLLLYFRKTKKFISTIQGKVYNIKYSKGLSNRNIHLIKRTVQEWVD